MRQHLKRVLIPLVVLSCSGCTLPSALSDWELPKVQLPLPAFLARGASEKDSEYARARKKLKNPEKTFLSYARWREDAGSPGEARRIYSQILQENPGNAGAIMGLARLDQKSGLADRAIESLQVAISDNPRSNQLKQALAEVYIREERFDDAVPHLQACLEGAPTHIGFRFSLAVAQTENGEVDKALNNFAQCVGRAEAYYNAGYLLQQRGDDAAAKTLYRKSLELNPDLRPPGQMLAALLKRGDEGVESAKPAEVIAHATEHDVTHKLPAIHGRPSTIADLHPAADTKQMYDRSRQFTLGAPKSASIGSLQTDEGVQKLTGSITANHKSVEKKTGGVVQTGGIIQASGLRLLSGLNE